jgi:hypothetical protein
MVMLIVRIAAGAVIAALVALTPAQAAKRVALVIGNDRYAPLPRLRNAVADARLVAETLKTELQFQVFTGLNLDYRATNRLHADFEAAINPGDTAFVFFAGHGVAFGAENYLLPIDTEKPRTGEENLVRSEAHAVDALVRRVQARGAVASFFVIDACRDNPFEVVGVRSIGGSRGLARTDLPTGVFVLFSAGIGQAALDQLNDADNSPNSVFTRTLVPLLRQPGLTHLAIAKRVQTEVWALAASVSHQQQPAFYDQINGEVVFKAAPAPPAVASLPATVSKLQDRVTGGATSPTAPVYNKLEERIAKSFEGFEATLPRKVDDVTTMVSAKHTRATITFGYRVDVDGSRLGDQVKAKVREIATKDICGETHSREILDLGGSFHLDYVDKNEQPVTEVDIVKSNCS